MKLSVARKLLKEIDALQTRSTKLTDLVRANVDNDLLTPIKMPIVQQTLSTITKQEFNKLPVTERRVLIAKDVLAALKAEKIVATQGLVLETEAKEDDSWNDTCSVPHNQSVKTAIDKAAKCHVCAKGSVIFSLARKFNTVKGMSIDTMYRGVYNKQDELDTKKIFGEDLWSELEAQFEGSAEFRSEAVHALFGSNDSDYIDSQPLDKLMKNLVRNKGKLRVDGKLIG